MIDLHAPIAAGLMLLGLFDLPAPLLTLADDRLAAWLPASVRIIVWAFVAALILMELYRLVSPQKTLARLRLRLVAERRALNDFDGEFDAAWPLMRGMLATAFKRVFLIIPSSIITLLPLVALILWLDSRFGVTLPPPGADVPVAVEAPTEHATGQMTGRTPAIHGQWVAALDGLAPQVRLRDTQGRLLADIVVAAPVAVISKWHWWHVLAASPAGYLPDDLPVEQIRLGLPVQDILGMGPAWLRGWEAPFFGALLVFALVFKRVRRIE